MFDQDAVREESPLLANQHSASRQRFVLLILEDQNKGGRDLGTGKCKVTAPRLNIENRQRASRAGDEETRRRSLCSGNLESSLGTGDSSPQKGCPPPGVNPIALHAGPHRRTDRARKMRRNRCG